MQARMAREARYEIAVALADALLIRGRLVIHPVVLYLYPSWDSAGPGFDRSRGSFASMAYRAFPYFGCGAFEVESVFFVTTSHHQPFQAPSLQILRLYVDIRAIRLSNLSIQS